MGVKRRIYGLWIVSLKIQRSKVEAAPCAPLLVMSVKVARFMRSTCGIFTFVCGS